MRMPGGLSRRNEAAAWGRFRLEVLGSPDMQAALFAVRHATAFAWMPAAPTWIGGALTASSRPTPSLPSARGTCCNGRSINCSGAPSRTLPGYA